MVIQRGRTFLAIDRRIWKSGSCIITALMTMMVVTMMVVMMMAMMIAMVVAMMVAMTYDLMMEASRDTQSLSSDPPRRLGMRPHSALPTVFQTFNAL